MVIDTQLAEQIADILAPKLLARVEQIVAAKSGDQDFVYGTAAIARTLGISEDTLRRRLLKKLPICGYDEYNHRGQLRLRPICKRGELIAFRENLRPKKNNQKV